MIAKINGVLGTKLNLKKLNKKDLEILFGAISKPVSRSLLGNLGGMLNRPLSEVLKDRAGRKPIGEMTLNDVLGAIGDSTDDKGPLGLGILPLAIKRFKG